MSIAAKLLELLSEFPEGIPQSNLAKALNVSKSYLSLLLRDLEKQGIIYRVRVGNSYIVKKAIYEDYLTKPRDVKGGTLRLGIVWSSEYLFLGHFAKLLKNREGIELKVYVYPNALQTVLALIRGEVDSILSPLVTQIYGYMISKNLIIAGGGAGGGGYVYELPTSDTDIVISSEISTMDLCRFIALRRGYIDSLTTRYFSTKSEAIAMVRRKMAKYAVVWHPLHLEIEVIGGRRILNCLDLEETSYCCTFALSRALDRNIVDRISKIYKESIEIFNKDRERFLEWYSAIVGIDLPIVKKALREYSYSPEIDPKYFSKLIGTLGIEIPTKAQLYQAIQL